LLQDSGASFEEAAGEGLLRVADVATQLGVSNATVYELCATGRLRHVRILNSIRIAPADLDAFLGGGAGDHS
jgi:excisionase family DNA binding protein